MKLKPNIVFARIKFFIFFFCISIAGLHAQTTDLSVRFLGQPPARVAIGEAFAIQAEVFHASGASLPVVGETITATLDLIDPNGIVISTYVQSSNGFPNPAPAATAELDNDSTAARQVILQLPWTEAQKIHYGDDFTPFTNDDAQWTVAVRVTSPSLETVVNNNSISHSFFVDAPDLRLDPNPQLRAKHPQTGQLTTNLFPDSRIEVSGTISNIGNAMTQPGARFTVEARLFEGSVTSNLFIPKSFAIDYERIILPASDGANLPTILAGNSVGYTISNLRLPADAEGNFTIQVIADVPDQDNVYPPPGNVVEELEEFDNNHQIITFTVDSGTPDLQINTNSFQGDIGTFNGLDPVRIAFAVRNNGTGAVQPTDVFTVRVALSTNDSFSNDDFILREFDLSGDALGANLLPNETINLDWIQQLPDNFEGDYYIISDIASGNQNQTFSFSNTPIITLVSLNEGQTDLVDNSNSQIERPSTSFDGKVVAYERLENGIKQIYFRDFKSTSLPTALTNGDYDSLNPKVSGNGSKIVFHSRASNLVPEDTNGHEDIFLFDVASQQIQRVKNFVTGEQGNGGSFYASIDYNGTKIVFESEATNFTQVPSSGRQVYLWDTTVGTYGEIYKISNGNGNSFDASIDGSGNRIAFSSLSTNLVNGDLNSNGYTDIFLYDVNSSTTTRINKNFFGIEAIGGASNQPKISGDGKVVAFRSLATNLVTGKGISNLSIETSGVGYYGNPTIVINDPFGNGEGAELAFTSDAIDLYGQIRSGGIEIISSGKDYSDPQVAIIPDPNFPPPAQVASVKANITHPLGEVYSVNLDAFLANDFSTIKRISENSQGVGGDMPSREPDISYDGKSIVYSTQASNLLGNQVTRADGKVFYNQPVRQARAQAILVGGIGEIEVLASGAGYSNGFLSVNDISGSGSGAIASYEVDSFGRISSITMVNPGSNYDLATTVVQVDNPRGGSGFVAGALRFAEETGIGGARVGGGKVHRIEMIEHGLNYQSVASSALGLQSLLAIDGDGVDSDNDGKPDAKINPDRIKIDSAGGIYMEQIFDFTISSSSSLLATSIGVEDANKSIVINFSTNDSLPFTIGINNRSLSQIRDKIIEVIMDQWNHEIWQHPEPLFDGPQIENNSTGGTTFTLRALSGKVVIDNSASIQVITRSNMLFSGSGFTRATPYIAPPPTIHGFSEISSQTTFSTSGDGRQVYNAQPDYQTDDIYLFDENTGQNGRVSLSTFGYPANYLSSGIASMPSNRFPSISGDGRYVMFSSDSTNAGGLVFDGSNQLPADLDQFRDIYVRDTKSNANYDDENLSNFKINWLFPNNDYPLSHNTSLPFIFNFDGPNNMGSVFAQIYWNGLLVGDSRLGAKNSPILGQPPGNQVNPITQFGDRDDFHSHHFIFDLNITHLQIGEHNAFIQIRNTNIPTQILASTELRTFNVINHDSSRAPFISMNDVIYEFATDKSTIPLSAQAWDYDGQLKEVQFFANGQKLGNPVLAENLIEQRLQTYSSLYKPSSRGVYTFHAIALDNSGNYVHSKVQVDGNYTMNITGGTDGNGTKVKLISNYLKSHEVGVDLEVDSEGAIEKVTISDPKFHADGLGSFFTTPKATIYADGNDAEIRVRFEDEKVHGFTISDTENYGYSDGEAKVRISPVLRAIKKGTEGELLQVIVNGSSTAYAIKNTFDGTPLSGEGYITAPSFFPGTIEGDGVDRIDFDRWPILDDGNGVGRLDNTIDVSNPGIDPLYTLTGGFTRSPVYIEYQLEKGENYLNIDEVTLLIDGSKQGVEQEIVKTKPNLSKDGNATFSFTWVPEEVKFYTIAALVRDHDGNLQLSDETTVYIGEYNGTGPVVSFSGDANTSVAEVGSDEMFQLTASSEYGIQSLELYLDGVSLGMASQQNKDSNDWYHIERFEDVSRGEHFISYVAIDNAGNMVGSHNPLITNLTDVKHKSIIISPSKNKKPPKVSFITKNEKGENNETERLKIKWGQPVKLFLFAETDSEGFPEEISLYQNGARVLNVNGDDHVSYDPNSPLHTNGVFEFEFIANVEGNFSLRALVQDSFNARRFSDENESLEIEVIRKGSLMPVISLFDQPISSQARISHVTRNSKLRLTANAFDPDGAIEHVQFYLDGNPFGKEVPYNRFSRQANYPFGTDLNWTEISEIKPVHVITALAKDNSDNYVFSEPLVFTVTNGDNLIPEVSMESINAEYESNRTIFLSAEVQDQAINKINNKEVNGTIVEFKFVANGIELNGTSPKPPYFNQWTPTVAGRYEVYAIARDNEGNYGVSEIFTTEIKEDPSLVDQPSIALNPTVSGESKKISVIRRTGRRNTPGGTNEPFTVIQGLDTNFLNQLVEGQKVKFAYGDAVTENSYTIYKINNSNELELYGEMLLNDQVLLNNWTELQIVRVFRVGSRIPLHLKESVDDSEFQYVDFFQDGTRIGRDTTWPFSQIFIPQKEGNYTIATYASNVLGNANISTERIFVEPKIKSSPEGTTQLIPNQRTVTIGSELTVVADYVDFDDGMDRVEFYLNGSLEHVDNDSPFSYKFKPQSEASTLFADRSWEMTIVGYDKAGNAITDIEAGTVNGSVIFPDSRINSPLEGEEFTDGQVIDIRIDILGTNMDGLTIPREVDILANGEFVVTATEDSVGSGVFLATWRCDKDLAGDFGDVELVGTTTMIPEQVEITQGVMRNFTPVITTVPVTLKVVEPNLAGSPKAAVNQVYQDILGYSPSEQEVNLAVSDDMDSDTYLFDNESFLNWVSHLTEREIFQNTLDAIAGYHIMVGSWPDYLKIRDIIETYSAIPNYGADGTLDSDGDGFSARQERLFLTSDQDASDIPNNAFNIGSFVDDVFSSREFTDVYGVVPELTPPPSGPDRFTNYEQNRREFVRILFKNKYGKEPTLQQEIQGSYRISVFDPNSQQARQDQQRQMIQQLAMFSSFGGGGFGGGGGNNNNNQLFQSLLGNNNNNNQQQPAAPSFQNGQPAVLFTINMIAEEKIDSLDMIWGAGSRRAYYFTAAMIASFWQENLEILSDDLISKYSALPRQDLVSALIKDPRYFERFGGLSISRHASEVEDAPGWKKLDWLGHFNDSNFPWIFHSGLGWIYVHGPTDEQTWFYIPQMGWLGTTQEVWSEIDIDSNYLWLYDQNQLKWIAYLLEEPAGRIFWDPQDNEFFTLD